MTDAQTLELFVVAIRQFIPEQVDQPRIKRKLPFRAGEPDRAGGEALAERKQHMGEFGGIRFLPPLRDHPAVPHDHEAVDGIQFFDRPEKREQRGGRDPLRLRRRTRQQFSHVPLPLPINCRFYADN